MSLGTSFVEPPFSPKAQAAGIAIHGEGGTLVGAPLAGRVLIIDDVISAGTSLLATLTTPRPPSAIRGSVMASSPERTRKSVRPRCRRPCRRPWATAPGCSPAPMPCMPRGLTRSI